VAKKKAYRKSTVCSKSSNSSLIHLGFIEAGNFFKDQIDFLNFFKKKTHL
jgi:hypothetical protein